MLFSNLNVGYTLCSSIYCHPSINTASYFEQNFLGFLCLSRSGISVTSASCYAEHKGRIPERCSTQCCKLNCVLLIIKSIFVPVNQYFNSYSCTNSYIPFFLRTNYGKSSLQLNFIKLFSYNLSFVFPFNFSDCWTIHGTLCTCTWSCKVLKLRTLGPPGLTTKLLDSCLRVWYFTLAWKKLMEWEIMLLLTICLLIYNQCVNASVWIGNIPFLFLLLVYIFHFV